MGIRRDMEITYHVVIYYDISSGIRAYKIASDSTLWKSDHRAKALFLKYYDTYLSDKNIKFTHKSMGDVIICKPFKHLTKYWLFRGVYEIEENPKVESNVKIRRLTQ